MRGTAAQHDKFVRMTTEPVGKLVTELAVPSIVSMLVTALYNIADTFFVGRLNTQSVAALGIVFAYMTLIQAISMFCGQGSGNYISRALGREETEGAGVMASVGLVSSVGTGLLLSFVGFIAMDPILHFFGSTPTILPFARDYFTYILIGAPFIMGCFTMNNQMRHQGNAMLSMIGIASGAVLNIALDPLLIFHFGMGVKGAGLATAISQAAGFFVMLSLSGKRGGIRIRLDNFRPSLTLYRDIAAGGLPSLARQGLLSIAAICLNQMAARYGDESVAAFSIVSRVTMIASAAMIGYGQGFQPVCGFNFGAGKFDRVRKAFRYGCIVSTIYCLFLAVLGFIFAGGLVSTFRADDAEVVRIGSRVLRFQCISFPLSGFVVMSNMYLQNIRRTWPAVIMASARQGIFFLPALFIGHWILGFLGLEIAQTVSDALSFCLAIPLCSSALKSMGKEPTTN
jgi:putative MATE family efflux protein